MCTKMMITDDNEASAVINSIGFFYIFKKATIFRPEFTIRITKADFIKIEMVRQLAEYLNSKHNIHFCKYTEDKYETFKITNRPVLLELINFMNKNCFVEKKNQKEIYEFLNV